MCITIALGGAGRCMNSVRPRRGVSVLRFVPLSCDLISFERKRNIYIYQRWLIQMKRNERTTKNTYLRMYYYVVLLLLCYITTVYHNYYYYVVCMYAHSVRTSVPRFLNSEAKGLTQATSASVRSVFIIPNCKISN